MASRDHQRQQDLASRIGRTLEAIDRASRRRSTGDCLEGMVRVPYRELRTVTVAAAIAADLIRAGTSTLSSIHQATL